MERMAARVWERRTPAAAGQGMLNMVRSSLRAVSHGPQRGKVHILSTDVEENFQVNPEIFGPGSIYIQRLATLARPWVVVG